MQRRARVSSTVAFEGSYVGHGQMGPCNAILNSMCTSLADHEILAKVWRNSLWIRSLALTSSTVPHTILVENFGV